MKRLFRETTKAWVDDPGPPVFLKDGSFLTAADMGEGTGVATVVVDIAPSATEAAIARAVTIEVVRGTMGKATAITIVMVTAIEAGDMGSTATAMAMAISQRLRMRAFRIPSRC